MTLSKNKTKTIRDALITLFKNNIASLNVSLNATFTTDLLTEQIRPGDTFNVTFASAFPYILVSPFETLPEWAGAGAGGRKKVEQKFYIYGFTRVITDDDHAEIMNLADNIVNLLDNNIEFDASVYESKVESIRYVNYGDETIYVRSVEIILTARVEVV